MSTNIRPEHISAFEALTSGKFDNLALFSCFVNGTPTSAIVAIKSPLSEGDDYEVTPLFVFVTDDMVLTDHDAVSCNPTPDRHEITIIFGSDAVRLYEEGSSDAKRLGECGSIETYSFQTQREKQQFLRGVEEALGWQDFIIANRGGLS